MKRSLSILMTLLLTAVNLFGQVKFQTMAEKSDYKSTSDYKDVMFFINHLKNSSHYIRSEYIAMSTEGREIPLLIIGNPLPKSPRDLARDKRIVVYIQADIHAGEVEGKEATLMYVRDLLEEKNSEILKNVI